MKNKLLIIGSGGHCLSCINIIERENKFKIVGLVDKIKTNKKIKYKIIGNDSELEKLKKKSKYAFIALGQIKSSKVRRNIYKNLQKLNFSIPKIISKNSVVSNDAKILDGSIIMNMSHVNANVKIGKNCIINSYCNIEHDVEIKDFVHISTGVIINGGCKIGSDTFIGSGAIIHNNINIGKNCIIGAGKIISKNLKSGSIIK